MLTVDFVLISFSFKKTNFQVVEGPNLNKSTDLT